MSRTKNTFATAFYCKQAKVGKDGKASIICSISAQGTRDFITLPLKCKPDEFKALLSDKKINDVKTLCTATQLKLEKIYTQLMIDEQPITAKRIKDIYINGTVKTSYSIKDMYDAFYKQKMLERIEPVTWQKYVNAMNDFLKYTGHTYSDMASSVTFADVLTFEAKAMQVYAETTVKKKEKNIKAFFSLAVAAGKIKANPFGTYKIGKGTSESPTEYLTYDEIQKVKSAPVQNDRLDKVRDMFLWQCFTGQNISDLRTLSPSDVQQNDKGQYYISKNRYKTGRYGKKQQYTSILFEDAVEIYKVYEGKIPYISDQKYNVYLKELMTLAGINKHITSKSGRTTYACYVYNHLQIHDLSVIQKMLGHSNIQQTQEYVRIFDNTIFDAVAAHIPEEYEWITHVLPLDPQKPISIGNMPITIKSKRKKTRG